jgi:hypothetical protein
LLRLSGVIGSFSGVGGEGFEHARDDTEAAKGDDDAGLVAEVFGIAGAVEVGLQLFNLVLELIGGQVLCEACFFLLLEIGFHGEGFGEPMGDASDDLANAGLGNPVFFGDPASGNVIDKAEAVDVEVAGSGRK